MGKNLRLFTVFLVLILTLSIMISGCGRKGDLQDQTPGEPDSESSDVKGEVMPYEGYLAPDFELKDIDDNIFKLSELQGKTVIVNFWSMGCKFCLQEMPDFDAFNKSKSEDVVLLMVNLDTDARKVPTYIKNQEYGFTVLLDEEASTVKPYMIRGVPTTIIVGKDGKIAFRMEGALTKEQLETLVSEQPKDEKPQPS